MYTNTVTVVNKSGFHNIAGCHVLIILGLNRQVNILYIMRARKGGSDGLESEVSYELMLF